MNLTTISITSLLLAATSANAGVWSFSDDEFDSDNWTNSAYVVAGDAASIVLHQPNGDPEDNGYLGMEFTSEGDAVATAVSLSEHARYDPSASGAISQFAFGYQMRTHERSFNHGYLALVQDGVVYALSTTGFADEPGDWISFSGSGLDASAFHSRDPETNVTDFSAHPDFSSSGSEIQFGMLNVYYNNTGEPGWGVRDYDEFDLRIISVPAPGAACLFGLAGMTAARRRR